MSLFLCRFHSAGFPQEGGRGGGVSRGDHPTRAEPTSVGMRRQRDAELLRSRNIQRTHMSPLSDRQSCS